MRLLVTGRGGQVARSLVEAAARCGDVEVVATGRPQLDLLQPASVFATIASHRPDIVVSAAAYTDVDRAEDEPELAAAVNRAGAGAVSAAAGRLGVPVIHLSTDYVFSGQQEGERAEGDEASPLSVYGKTKLDGEAAVAAANPRHVILRTARVYSAFGRNFVRTILGLARERDELRVVADQQGNPTSATDLAEGILHVARRLGDRHADASYGIFHLAGTGSESWSSQARGLLTLSAELGGPTARVVDIAAADYPARARRPQNARLSTERFWRAYGWRAPQWQASCRPVIQRLLAEPGQ